MTNDFSIPFFFFCFNEKQKNSTEVGGALTWGAVAVLAVVRTALCSGGDR